MKCYKKSKRCWGREEMCMIEGQVTSSCSGHRWGAYVKPRICIKVIDADIADIKTINDYLYRFIESEIGDVMFYVYGDGVMGEIEADLLVSNCDNATIKEGYPTHMFVVVDLLKDNMDYFDAIDDGVVINTVTL